MVQSYATKERIQESSKVWGIKGISIYTGYWEEYYEVYVKYWKDDG